MNVRLVSLSQRKSSTGAVREPTWRATQSSSTRTSTLETQEVLWAVTPRTDPAVDIDIIQRGVGSKNDPMFIAYPYEASLSSKAIIDACRPYDRLDTFPEVAEVSRELEEKVRAKWRELL